MELKVIQYNGLIVPFDIEKMIHSLMALGYPDTLVPKSIARQIAEKAQGQVADSYGENPIYIKLLIDIVEGVLIDCGYDDIAKVYRNQPISAVDVDKDHSDLAILDGMDFHISELNFYACNLFNFKDGVLGTEFWCNIHRSRMGLQTYTDTVIGIFNDNKVTEQCKVKCIPGVDHLLMPATRYTFLEEYRQVLLNKFPNYSISINELLKCLHNYELPHVSILTEQGMGYIIEQTTIQLGKLDESRIRRWIHQAKTTTREIAHTCMFRLLNCLYNLINKDTVIEYIPSINLGTCISKEGRIVMIALLTVWRDLIEIDKYQYHPTLVVKLKKGINRIGDPNHDIVTKIYEFSIDRRYIRYLNLDTVYNLPYYRYLTPYSEISAMSCFNGDTVLRVKIDGKEYRELVAVELMSILSVIIAEKDIHALTVSKIYDLTDYHIDIYDSISSGYVKCLKFIVNADNCDWHKLSIAFICKSETCRIRHYYLTADHLLPTNQSRFMEVCDITIHQELLPTDSYHHCKAEVFSNIPMGYMGELGYDLETVSGTFDLNGICSHNCRTRIIEKLVDVNQDFISNKGDLINAYLNLPRIAIKSNYRIDKFYTNLDLTISVMTLKVLQRIDRISSPLLPYTFNNYNNCDVEKSIQLVAENIRHKDVDISLGGTISINYVGLAECIYALTGKIHGSDDSLSLGLDITKHIYQLVKRYTEVLDISIKLSGKYHETLATRFATIDRRYFGYITGVTDKDRYSDSFHIADSHRGNLSYQIDKEVPYHRLCKGDSCSKFTLSKDDIFDIDTLDKCIELICDSDIGQFSLRTDHI